MKPFPAIVGWGSSPELAVPAGSFPFELIFVQSQRCPCGGRFQTEEHALVSEPPRELERHEASCEGCGSSRPFWFDVSSFVDDPRAVRRFQELRHLFQEGLDLVDVGDLDGASLRFSEVVAREPFFGLAHYHLGMIATVGKDWGAAREHLTCAAGLLPLDPTVRQGLSDLWMMTDDMDRAAVEEALGQVASELTGEPLDEDLYLQ